MLCFSVTYAFYKACAPFLPAELVIFFQSLCSWLLIAPFLLPKGQKVLATPHLPLIILRTLFGLATLYLVTRALMTTGLAETLLLNNTAPLFVPLIVRLWHKTKIPHRIWLSLMIGFFGVVIVLQPGAERWNAGVVYALLSGVTSAFLLVIARQIAHEPFSRLMFYYFLVMWVLLAPFLLTSWTLPPMRVWVYLVLAAGAMISGQVALTAAMRRAPAHEVAPLLYSSVVFSGLIDWVVWGVTVSFLSLLGMGVVCLGGVATILLNRRGAR
jgi:drug/metabolite transporter (DMT)-like permease